MSSRAFAAVCALTFAAWSMQAQAGSTSAPMTNP